MHASGMGKVMLAFGEIAPEAAVAQLKELARFTEHTVAHARRVACCRCCSRHAGHGFALNLEERYLGVNGVAAPVLGATASPRCHRVQGPVHADDPRRFEEIAPMVRACSRRDRPPRRRLGSLERDARLPRSRASRPDRRSQLAGLVAHRFDDPVYGNEPAVGTAATTPASGDRHRRRCPRTATCRAASTRRPSRRGASLHRHLDVHRSRVCVDEHEHRTAASPDRRCEVVRSPYWLNATHRPFLDVRHVAAALVSMRHEHALARLVRNAIVHVERLGCAPAARRATVPAWACPGAT